MNTSSTDIVPSCRLLVIDLEPTPYKTDLWNVFSSEVELYVVYTERKNWAPDGGHDFQSLPEFQHEHIVLEGRGLAGKLKSTSEVVRKISSQDFNLIYIAGYSRMSTMVAVLLASLLRRQFVLHSDVFNNGRPAGKFSPIKRIVRGLLRRTSFNWGSAVLVCGKRGKESTLKAGCTSEKILNFPYVIDINRINLAQPASVPALCQDDLDGKKVVIFFSGRMIPRKGLYTLLAALSQLETLKDWILWIEGDGPDFLLNKGLAEKLGVEEKCRFLGFCQYDLHSWLIRSSDIVVVPSLEDNWGIVVDEGLQLGKSVIASEATGSGYDLIDNGRNGFLFKAGDVDTLADLMSSLIDDASKRTLIGSNAASSSRNLCPRDNLTTLLNYFEKKL